MSNELVQEGELSLESLQINSPSSCFGCRFKNQDMESFDNPTVRANLMSDKFALGFLGSEILSSTDRKLRRSSRSLVNSYGELKNVSMWHGKIKVILNFYVLEYLHFNFLIGHPIKAILNDAQSQEAQHREGISPRSNHSINKQLSGGFPYLGANQEIDGPLYL